MIDSVAGRVLLDVTVLPCGRPTTTGQDGGPPRARVGPWRNARELHLGRDGDDGLHELGRAAGDVAERLGRPLEGELVGDEARDGVLVAAHEVHRGAELAGVAATHPEDV